jgi:hypothetical protein
MYNYSGIPPFGLATITAELKSKGLDIEQDDLDAKCAADELFPRHRWGKSFPAKDLMLDIERRETPGARLPDQPGTPGLGLLRPGRAARAQPDGLGRQRRPVALGTTYGRDDGRAGSRPGGDSTPRS